MMRMAWMRSSGLFTVLSLALVMLSSSVAKAADGQEAPTNLLVNGGFETAAESGKNHVAEGWAAVWARDAGTASAVIDSAIHHSGNASLHVEHHGLHDWSVASTKPIPVSAGQILELRGWLKAEATHAARLCVTSLDAKGKAIDWELAYIESKGTHDWREMARSMIVPAGCAAVQVRFIGEGQTTVWLDDASLTLQGDVSALQTDLQGKQLTLENSLLSVRLDAISGTLWVTDKRINHAWEQKEVEKGVIVTGAHVAGNSLHLSLLDLGDNLRLAADITLPADRAELEFSLNGKGELTQRLAYPPPFVTGEKTWIVLPMNEGIMYPAGDASVKPTSLVCYSGHGICMPWYGVTDSSPDSVGHGGAGMMAIIHTPNDADVDMARREGTDLFVRPRWEPTRGQFGYARSLTWVFLDKGGYPAQAKRYRDEAISTGLLKTLAQKQKENPNVDLLVGAPNVWNFDMDPVALCQQFKSAGVERVLWSRAIKPAQIDAINAMGYLTSRYDIFQDVWAPGKPAWAMHDGWPEELVLLPDRSWMKGWAHIQKNRDGTKTVFEGGVISSPCQVQRAKVRIPEELKTHAYHCRFIDTTTASPWREDYNPAHPLTRTEDRKYKMQLLDFCSKGCNLVVGTETGIDPSVPYVHYFEGMMSLAPYRLPDSGRDILEYRTPTPEFLKYQVGEYYRIPLWELVYHDCVVADWYWGDASNKAPEVWDRRNLFNILYATPPLFMFDKTMWAKDHDRFVQTCKDVCPIVRRLGYAQMLSHEFLTSDHAVQQTTWSDGARITVNFGGESHALSGGREVKPMGFVVEEAH